jgi:hypothetical protein
MYTTNLGYAPIGGPFGNMDEKPRCGWQHYTKYMVVARINDDLVWACPNDDCKVIKPYGSTSAHNLNPTGHAGDGPNINDWKETVQYRVIDLPAGEEAWINRTRINTWTIVRAANGVQALPKGSYKDLKDALDALTVLRAERKED